MDALSQIYLDVNGISKHLSSDKEYNERNFGLGLSYETRKKADDLIKTYAIGGYKNSYNDPSYYAAAGLSKRFPITKNLYADLGGAAGLVTGYEGGINPMAMPMGAIGLKDLWKLRMMYAPETEKNEATLMMNLGIPIK